VAVAAGRAAAGLERRSAVVLALAFGGAHAGMTATGWMLGTAAKPLIEHSDHWIAFGLLAALGAKMIIDGRRATATPGISPILHARTIVLLSIATSIDALAVGITLPVLGVYAPAAIAIIGCTAVACSLVGAFGGAALGARFGRRLELAGGLVLIAVGVKTLIDHLSHG
jgi:putative Mn2+ efflux pump MntP